ncbi:hypothetical protein SLS56_007000 [Neofusicoccum ribis]|uniref:Glycine-rich cell wall structural protein 1 n=1 Tax=Neofusicoccum ribis TaxID=45134 RepID=A0ABR3SQ03_9PEZI
METINNIATSASKLIYGDPKAEQSGQEPVSGQTGRGTAEEPYDSGNLEGNPELGGKSAQETREYPTSSVGHQAGSHSTATAIALDPHIGASQSVDTQARNTDGSDIGSTTTGAASSLGADAGSTSLVDRTKDFGESQDANFQTAETKIPSSDNKTGVAGTDTSVPTSGATSNPLSDGSAATTATSAAQGGAIRPEHQTEGTGVTSLHSNDPHGSDVRPSESNASSGSERILAGAGTTSAGGFSKAEPSVGADPSSAQKPVAKQQGGDKPTAVPTTSTETDAVKDKKDEGEAALAKRGPNDHSGEPLKVHDGSEKKEAHSGQDGGDTKSGEEQGTGEKHVKTTGFKADGGDFDASLPGAGREADRLLEQKGVHKSSGAGGAADSSKNDSVSPARSAGSGEKTKTSMGTKIKEKLHIGSKHKSGSD